MVGWVASEERTGTAARPGVVMVVEAAKTGVWTVAMGEVEVTHPQGQMEAESAAAATVVAMVEREVRMADSGVAE